MTHPAPAALSDSHNSSQKMKIDKLTLLLDLPKEWHQPQVSALISAITDPAYQAQLGIARAYSPGCGGYEVSVAGKVPLSTSPLIWSKKAGYLLQAGPKGNKPAPCLRLDVNPEALTTSGMAYLEQTLGLLCEAAWPCWRFARVSRLDIAIDVYGVELADWVWDLPRRTARDIVCRKGEVRTLYLGAKTASPLAIYNKGKEDPAFAGGQSLTRVEYRFKNPGMVSQLPKLGNPFADVEVFNPRKLPLPEPHGLALMSVGHLHGWRGIVRTFPKAVRKQREKELMKTCAPWWDPAELWEDWGQCLKTTLPSLFTPPAAMDGAALAYLQSMEADKASGLDGTPKPSSPAGACLAEDG